MNTSSNSNKLAASRKPSDFSTPPTDVDDSEVLSVASSVSIDYRDWQDIKLSELVQEGKLIFISGDMSIEEAFHKLSEHNLTSLPVEEFEDDINCITFDYSDLNTYLLLVLNKIEFIESELIFDPHFQLSKSPKEYLAMIRQGEQVPVKFVCQLTSKNPFIKLNENMDTLAIVIEIFGSGVHRVAIINNENRITGILSQRRLIKYIWDNLRNFPSLDSVMQSSIDELSIGSSDVIFVYGDQPLIDALLLMYKDQISSVAVVDRQKTLLGNISITDVKHVTKSSQSHLLNKSCLHFVSVILNSRGLEDGQDSFPVFHVFPTTSLARTVAKLVATKAHRLWIVKPRSNSSFSSPSKPPLISADSSTSSTSSGSGSQFLNIKPEINGRAGKLIGVVSLTDILGLIARKSSKKQIDPHAARKQRRRSSSSASSLSVKSLESMRRNAK